MLLVSHIFSFNLLLLMLHFRSHVCCARVPHLFFHSSHHYRLAFFFAAHCTSPAGHRKPSIKMHSHFRYQFSQLVCQPSFVPMVCACMHTVVSKCEKQKNHVHLSITAVLPCSWRCGLAVGSRRLECSAVHCAPIPLTVLLWLEEQKKCVRLKEAFGVQTVCGLKGVRRERVAPS